MRRGIDAQQNGAIKLAYHPKRQTVPPEALGGVSGSKSRRMKAIIARFNGQ